MTVDITITNNATPDQFVDDSSNTITSMNDYYYSSGCEACQAMANTTTLPAAVADESFYLERGNGTSQLVVMVVAVSLLCLLLLRRTRRMPTNEESKETTTRGCVRYLPCRAGRRPFTALSNDGSEPTLSDLERAEMLPTNKNATGLESYNGQSGTL